MVLRTESASFDVKGFSKLRRGFIFSLVTNVLFIFLNLIVVSFFIMVPAIIIFYVLGIFNRSQGWRLLAQPFVSKVLKIGYFLSVYGISALVLGLFNIGSIVQSSLFFLILLFPYVAAAAWIVYSIFEYKALGTLEKLVDSKLHASRILIILGILSLIPTVLIQVPIAFVFLLTSCTFTIKSLQKVNHGERVLEQSPTSSDLSCSKQF